MDEAGLIASAQNGDANAFEALVGRYETRLYRLLVMRAAVRSDADDALQETMLAAWRFIGSYKPRWKFSTWLFRIGLRNLARQGGRSFAPPEIELADETALDPESSAAALQNSKNLWELAGQRLDRDSLTALWLRYGEELKVREIADAMEKSPGWVKVRLLRARRALEKSVLVRELAADIDAGFAPANGSCS